MASSSGPVGGGGGGGGGGGEAAKATFTSLRAPVLPNRRWGVDEENEGVGMTQTTALHTLAHGRQRALLVGGWLACPAARGKMVPYVAVAFVAKLR